uniref:Olfactory receptor n=1 Tax=Engystomops pustulosus TaxID=76066 RepID=A0AAV6YSM2_ENGPU|nr:hypothetical protein GDO81_023256 [Engystomops pustulosus]
MCNLHLFLKCLFTVIDSFYVDILRHIRIPLLTDALQLVTMCSINPTKDDIIICRVTVNLISSGLLYIHTMAHYIFIWMIYYDVIQTYLTVFINLMTPCPTDCLTGLWLSIYITILRFSDRLIS